MGAPHLGQHFLLLGLTGMFFWPSSASLASDFFLRFSIKRIDPLASDKGIFGT
jgi:hypothetical protein